MENNLQPIANNGEVKIAEQSTLGGALLSRLVWTSLDISKESEREKMLAALTGENLSIWFNRPIALDVQDVVIAETEELDDETGEFTRKLRTRFIAPNGQVWMTGSKVVYGKLQLLAQGWGPPPWFPARKIYFFGVRTGEGGECLIASNQPKQSPQVVNSGPQPPDSAAPSDSSRMKTPAKPGKG